MAGHAGDPRARKGSGRVGKEVDFLVSTFDLGFADVADMIADVGKGDDMYCCPIVISTHCSIPQIFSPTESNFYCTSSYFLIFPATHAIL